MATAEQLGKSIRIEGRGVHVLLWDDQDDLVRALVVTIAALDNIPLQPMLLSSAEESVSALRPLFEHQASPEPDIDPAEESLQPARETLLVLFLQQATSRSLGPWLNGWRSTLAEPPGTLLVVRDADYTDFQRHAPDLTSFVGPKICDASSLLSTWSEETARKIKPELPKEFRKILKELPGQAPRVREIKDWMEQHPPIGSD